VDRPEANERVGGYRVVKRLATGGTSDVLLAKAEGPHGFERTVVLKVLLSQYRGDEELSRMFAREASAYARLSHPAIVQLYDFFSVDAQLVMVLEYVDGPSLHRLRGMLKAVGHALDDRAVFHVACQIFSALAAAHEATDDEGAPSPVIHRDVNPSNVLVSWDGQVKLADFGVAKVTGLSQESRSGVLRGTYGYMAPEQVKGEMVTPRADVYAGGIVLWEMLTRRRAFRRGALPEVEVLRQMAEPHVMPLDTIRPDLERGLRDAVRRTLDPRPEKRNVTAEEMVAVLRTLVGPEEGRELLQEALARVRHEPRPAQSTIPPPVGPAPRPPPRPAPPPRLPARPSHADLPAKREEASSVRAFDTSAEGRGRESERVRLGTPLEAIAPGLSLQNAIDEILRDVPSSLPPQMLGERGDRRSRPGPAPAALGRIPAAPPPLVASASSEVAAPSPAAPPPLPAPPPVASPERAGAAAEKATTAPMHPPVLPRSSVADATAGGPSAAALVAEAPAPAGSAPEHARRSAPATPSAAPAEQRHRRWGLPVALALMAALAGVAGVAALRWKKGHDRAAPAVVEGPVVAQAPPVAKEPVAEAPVVEEAAPAATEAEAGPEAAEAAPASPAPAPAGPAATAIPQGMGVLSTEGTMPGRRIYVDGRTRGQTPDAVTVPCGARTVKLGSAGRPREIEVPCGGTVVAADR
jgi:eukaryotic-like serine/threonine-protein kinase